VKMKTQLSKAESEEMKIKPSNEMKAKKRNEGGKI